MHARIATRIVALGMLQLATLPSETRPSSLAWWVENPMVKVHPGDPAPERAEHRVELLAARNEFEPFQLVLRTDDEDVSGLDIEISDLKGAGGAEISKSNAAVYLEQFVRITQPSMASGTPGLWPDPLLPRIDRYAHEKR